MFEVLSAARFAFRSPFTLAVCRPRSSFAAAAGSGAGGVLKRGFMASTHEFPRGWLSRLQNIRGQSLLFTFSDDPE